MSALTICKAVLEEVGWPTANSFSDASEATAKQIFALANAELVQLSEKHNWPHLEVEYTFNTVIGQVEYALPSDFRIVAAHSVFNADEYYRLRGSTDLTVWNRHKYGLLGSIHNQRFRLAYVGGDPVIQLAEAPTAAETVVLFYYTKEYALTSANASIPKYETDNDVSKIPENLVQAGLRWRFRRAKGLDYSAELAEYTERVRTQLGNYRAVNDVAVGRAEIIPEIAPGYVPDTGFGS